MDEKPKFVHQLPNVTIILIVLVIIFASFLSIPFGAPIFFFFITLTIALPVLLFIFLLIPYRIEIFENKIRWKNILTKWQEETWADVEVFHQLKGNALERSYYLRNKKTKQRYMALPVRKMPSEIFEFIKTRTNFEESITSKV